MSELAESSMRGQGNDEAPTDAGNENPSDDKTFSSDAKSSRKRTSWTTIMIMAVVRSNGGIGGDIQVSRA